VKENKRKRDESEWCCRRNVVADGNYYSSLLLLKEILRE
jgi:hypothetical protein